MEGNRGNDLALMYKMFAPSEIKGLRGEVRKMSHKLCVGLQW